MRKRLPLSSLLEACTSGFQEELFLCYLMMPWFMVSSSLYLLVEIPFMIMQLHSILPCSYFDTKVLEQVCTVKEGWKLALLDGSGERDQTQTLREMNGFTQVP